MTRMDETLDAAEPPQDWPTALWALWWLRKGDFAMGPAWDMAHMICQEAEGTPACDRAHALAHWIEGDRSNSDYWYRSAKADRGPDIETDWARQVADLAG